MLDGFEHIIDAAPLVAELLARTTRLTVLVTSRETLHLTGERVFEVPPLAVPTWSDSVEAARRSDSVQLFSRSGRRRRSRAAARRLRRYARSRRFANASMAFRSRSSWPPRG